MTVVGIMRKQSSMDVSVQSLVGRVAVRYQRLCEAVLTTLRRGRVGAAVVRIVLVKDASMRRLHAEFLGKPTTTDVLTFDMSDLRARGKSTAAIVEAEIVINVDAARREAVRRGHGLQAELALYVVHGTLHLLGFDDHELDSARRMHAMEDEILTEMGIGAVYGAAVNSFGRGTGRKQCRLRGEALAGDGRA